MLKKTRLLTALLSVALTTLTAYASDPATTQEAKEPARPAKAINEYIDYMVNTHHFKRAEITDIMNKAHYSSAVIFKITHPFEKKPWNFYRNYFLRADRIENGVKYWEKHQAILSKVSKEYGVPASVIIAIIGVESYYGEHAGGHNELDALTTLSFYYPKRSKFFKSELTHFLLLTKHEKLDPTTLQGSYAGALGIPQFMPSSYRNYGVDYSKNASIDLFTNHHDAIASIANYLKKSGWQAGKPIATPAITGKITPAATLISSTGRTKYPLSRLEKNGIKPATKIKNNPKAALIEMQNTDSNEYWIVFQNFRAIMSYNPRTTYALAVTELSKAIETAYGEKQKADGSPSAASTR